MKSIKKIILPFISLPLVATPFAMSSCSVYKDMLKSGYKVDYNMRTGGQISLDDATNDWNNMLTSHNRFLEQEIYKNADMTAHAKLSGLDAGAGLKYSVEFNSYQVYVKYAKVVDPANKIVSFKYNAEIEEKNNWYLNDVYVGYGIDRYTIDWEVQNLKYKVLEEQGRPIEGKNKLYVAPEIFNDTTKTFDKLTGNQKIIFNLRELVEIYGKNGIQSYGSEAKEAGTLDKDTNYIPSMQKMINFVSSFYSYYLWDCEKKIKTKECRFSRHSFFN